MDDYSQVATNAKILLVDDEPIILEFLKAGLSELGCELYCATSGHQALEMLATYSVDIVISDMVMPEMSGDELLQRISEQYPEIIRIVLTASPELSSILQAINNGHIWGYLQKPWDKDELIIYLKQAIYTQKVISEKSVMRLKLNQYQELKKKTFQDFVGDSSAMQLVYKSIESAAPSQASVFITGPSGTGKELVASAIHKLSRRNKGPYYVINCAAIPKELMESEIFGHIKGAFTGAVSTREGAAGLANGGTLFFDELGEMDIALQAKLLRFIQTGHFQKVGSDLIEKSDIRFVCATNRDPRQAIKENLLREDLYYRLNVVSIQLPPLCQRGHDVLILAQFFLEYFSQEEKKLFLGITHDTESLLLNYSWPGNVRQLRNCIHNCVVMSDGPLLAKESVEFALSLSPSHLRAPSPQMTPTFHPNTLVTLPKTQDEIITLAELEEQSIKSALEQFSGNVVEAAAALEVSPSTLYRKLSLRQH